MVTELIKLKDMNYAKLLIDYSGSGDSGDIDNITVEDSEGIEQNLSEISGIDKDIITDYCYSKLLQNIEDWYNNDGGYGRITIDLTDLSYSIENNIRIYDIETFEHSGEIENNI